MPAGHAAVPATRKSENGDRLFISYAREDLSDVHALQAQLAKRGFDLWLDLERLYAGEAFWSEICRAIDAAGAIVVLLSPSSLQSAHCQREIAYATAQHKRLVPVHLHDVDGEPISDALASVQWIRSDAQEPNSVAAAIVAAVQADWQWLRAHARLTVKGEEWRRSKDERSRLLRGRALREAEAWLLEPPPAKERATDLQVRFITASRRDTRRRSLLRSVAAVSTLAAVLLLSLRIAITTVERLNAASVNGLNRSSTDSVAAALAASGRAAAICGWLPWTVYPCRAAAMNLGVAQRLSRQFEDSTRTFSAVIDDLAASDPGLEREQLLFADALWSRAQTRLFSAMNQQGEARREEYEASRHDFNHAVSIFRSHPEADQREIAVTRVRFSIVEREYARALAELDQIVIRSGEPHFLRGLALVCSGDLTGFDLINKYIAELPDGEQSPVFRLNQPFLDEVRQCGKRFL